MQAITRTNRVYPPNKTHGLIVDYLGIFDDVAKSLAFDEKSVQQVISNIEELKSQLAPAMAAALRSSPASTAPSAATRDSCRHSPRSPTMHEGCLRPGLQHRLPTLGGAQPGPDARRLPRRLPLAHRRVRVRPPSDIAGRLVWHALGAKTVDLINEHVQVEIPRARRRSSWMPRRSRT